MTILYEPQMWGEEHAPFNAALVATVLASYPGREVSFLAESGHLEIVRTLLGQERSRSVEWCPVPIAPRDCSQLKSRLPFEWRLCEAVLDKAQERAAGRILACNITLAGLTALKAQLYKRSPQVETIIILHRIEALLASRRNRPLLCYANPENLRYVVLGEAIRNEVVRLLPILDRHIAFMTHPYLFPAAPEPSMAGAPIRLGFLGVGSAAKGFPTFCRLADEVLGSVPNATGKARFELVGHLDEGCRALLDTNPNWNRHGYVDFATYGTSFLPRNAYEERAKRLTYTVLPYDSASYRFTSSGAILDSLLHLKPCIVLRTELFEDYFRQLGDIGYLCDSYEEMLDTVKSLVADFPLDRYREQCHNILQGRKRFEPAFVSEELRSIGSRQIDRDGIVSALLKWADCYRRVPSGRNPL